ncbi:MAG: hypothetical protein IKX68_05050 [Clostridiales bacterium]|nr:hypothetical protein [Clostridiales bacterium]
MLNYYFVYGVRSFKKVYGPKGQPQACPFCHKEYQETYVKFRKYWHLDYIPLIPLGSDIYHFCPVCFYGDKFDKQGEKAAKALIKDTTPPTTHLIPRGVHHTAEKTWDLVVQDQISGEVFPVKTGMKKGEYKQLKKDRFYKNIDETNV